MISLTATPSQDPQLHRAGVLGLHSIVVLGGAAALSWELVWQLQASLAFGVSAVGTALTLAITMAGMAVGALVVGVRLRTLDPANPLRLYGALELVIGVSGLLLLPAFRMLEAVDARLHALAPAVASLAHVFGMALVLAPPTFAMGATVPVFQLVARRHRTRVSILYGLNTGGAALGVLLLTFWALPALGVRDTCLLVAAVNASVFAASWILSAPAPPRQAESRDASRERSVASLDLRIAWLVVFTTGFATFALEVAWFRAMRAAFWSTSAAFAIMLAAVLIPLAVGARLVPWLRRHGIAPGALLAGAGAAILFATPLVERLDLSVYVRGAYPVVMTGWFMLSLTIVGPAVLLLATALPWCLEEFRETETTGRLYGLNALGSVAGSLTTAWILLPAIGFARSAWTLGVIVLVLGLALPRRRTRLPGIVIGALALVLAITQSSSPGRDRMYGETHFGGARVLALDEGPDFTASVIQTRDGVRRLHIDGFAASGDKRVGGSYMEWMGSLPVLLHPNPERVLVICFGMGRTANAVRREEVGHVDVVDVSSGVLSLATHFPVNEGVLGDPRVEAHVMDGRAWLRRSPHRYQVITLEPMPPNFSGMNSLYSRDFYEIAARRLTPEGVIAQWLPFHLLTVEHTIAAAASFHAVFPDSALWIEPYGGTGILLGRSGPTDEPLGSSWPGLERRRVVRVLTEEQIRDALFLSPNDLARYVAGSDLVTDDNQLLAWGRMRPGLRKRAVQGRIRRNWRFLTESAGRSPLHLDPKDLENQTDAPGTAGPRR